MVVRHGAGGQMRVACVKPSMTRIMTRIMVLTMIRIMTRSMIQAMIGVAERVRITGQAIATAVGCLIKSTAARLTKQASAVFDPAKLIYCSSDGFVHTYNYMGTTIYAAFDGQHVFVQMDRLPESSIRHSLLTWFGVDLGRCVTRIDVSDDSRYYVQMVHDIS